jgi:hypothetical protein
VKLKAKFEGSWSPLQAWGQLGVNLGSTWGQLGVNLGSTWGQLWVNAHRPTEMDCSMYHTCISTSRHQAYLTCEDPPPRRVAG